MLCTAGEDDLAEPLCSLGYVADKDKLRKHLVAYVHGGRGSGDGYQLAPYPLLWVDVDALDWYVEQAARMERFGDEPYSFWEQAYQLASRGMYLPDEPYSSWAYKRRERIAGSLRQSVHALARLSLVRPGQAGEQEPVRLLRT